MGVQVSAPLAMNVLSTESARRAGTMELQGFMHRENLSMGRAHGDSEKTMISRAMDEAKRWARNAFGFALLVLGIVAIPTPGPGCLFFMLGLATLAAEFAWARRTLDYMKDVGLRLRATFAARRVAPGARVS
jgi:uncharacterized protein (TIGR02611 family)